MTKFDKPFYKKMAVAGAIAMNSAACAPGAGESQGAKTAHESISENNPESVQERLLDGMKVGLNDLGDGGVVLVAIESGLSIDGVEQSAKQELDDMKSGLDGVVFLPRSGAPKYEKASDGNFYVLVKINEVKQ